MWWRRKPEAQHGTAMGGSVPLIQLRGIGKTFPGDADEVTQALSDVTVDIGRGEYVRCPARQACGKSTFLAILGAARHADVWPYLLNGRRWRGCRPPRRRAMRNIEIGLIFQSFNLIGDMTVTRMSSTRSTLRGVDAARTQGARRRGARSRRAGQSRGSSDPGRSRAAISSWSPIARAIAGRPPILLADEPTGNLDSKSGEALMQMLGELHAGGATVCLATHDPRYIAEAKRHIYLFDGRVVDRAGALIGDPTVRWSIHAAARSADARSAGSRGRRRECALIRCAQRTAHSALPPLLPPDPGAQRGLGGVGRDEQVVRVAARVGEHVGVDRFALIQVEARARRGTAGAGCDRG